MAHTAHHCVPAMAVAATDTRPQTWREHRGRWLMTAAGVVAEAMVAIVLADAVLEKFGGDSVRETRRNLDAFLAGIPEALKTAPASEAALLEHDLA